MARWGSMVVKLVENGTQAADDARNGDNIGKAYGKLPESGNQLVNPEEPPQGLAMCDLPTLEEASVKLLEGVQSELGWLLHGRFPGGLVLCSLPVQGRGFAGRGFAYETDEWISRHVLGWSSVKEASKLVRWEFAGWMKGSSIEVRNADA